MNQFLVNAGYLLMLSGFLVRDILWLRSLLIAAQICLALYGWNIGRMPMLYWNGLFVIINMAWVGRILSERRPVTIPAELRDLYAHTFRAMSPQEFLQFWRAGRMVEKRDDFLIREGEQPSDLFLVLEGQAAVTRRGSSFTSLGRGHFVADMSFLTGQPASADVRAEKKVRAMAWKQSDLQEWKTAQPQLFMKLQGVLGAELASKIRFANLQLEQLIIES